MKKSLTNTFRYSPFMKYQQGLIGVLALGALCLIAVFSSAQMPETYENLQVLPQDISEEELWDRMSEFTYGLGLKCNSCHMKDTIDGNVSANYASDDSELKRKARTMLKITNEINKRLLPGLTRVPQNWRK